MAKKKEKEIEPDVWFYDHVMRGITQSGLSFAQVCGILEACKFHVADSIAQLREIENEKEERREAH